MSMAELKSVKFTKKSLTLVVFGLNFG